MSTEIKLVKYVAPSVKSNNGAPITILWNNARMVRQHSIIVCIKEILTIAESLDVVKIMVTGNPGTGKTELSRLLLHLLHVYSSVPYGVKVLTRVELLDFENTIKSLTHGNWILLFDDISFLEASATKHQIDILKKAMTEIRHFSTGDVKIIAIYVNHYVLGSQKANRGADFNFYTSIGSNEMENMQKTLGIQYTQKFEQFQKITKQALLKKKYAVPVGRNKFFVYSYRQPFAPALFFNGMGLRLVAFPKREFVDKLCGVCVASQMTEKDNVNIDDFVKQMSSKFGKQIGRNAVRIKLFQNGINVYPKRVKQAMMFMDQYMLNKEVNLQQIADHYKFENETTRLDAKLDEPIKTEEKIQTPI